MNKLRIKHVYFFLDKKDDTIKIGTSFNPLQRKEYLETKNNPYEILYVFLGGGRRKEKEFHIRFKKYRTKYEWFEYSKEIKEFISILKENELIWIGQDVRKIPKKTMPIGFSTDEKTFNIIEKIAEKKGRSIHNFTNYCLRRIARNENIDKIDIISGNEFAILYYSKCSQLKKQIKNLEKKIESYKKIEQLRKIECLKLISIINKKDTFIENMSDIFDRVNRVYKKYKKNIK